MDCTGEARRRRRVRSLFGLAAAFRHGDTALAAAARTLEEGSPTPCDDAGGAPWDTELDRAAAQQALLKALPVRTVQEAQAVVRAMAGHDDPVFRTLVGGSVEKLLQSLQTIAEQLGVAGGPAPRPGARHADAELFRHDGRRADLLARIAALTREEREAQEADLRRQARDALEKLAAAPVRTAAGVALKLRVFLHEMQAADFRPADPAPLAALLRSGVEAVERMAAEEWSCTLDEFAVDALEALPVEPTAGMIAAGAQAGGIGGNLARAVYAAMAMEFLAPTKRSAE